MTEPWKKDERYDYQYKDGNVPPSGSIFLMQKRSKKEDGRVGNKNKMPHFKREWNKFMKAYSAESHVSKQRSAPEQGDCRLLVFPENEEEGSGKDEREENPKMFAGD